MLKKIIEKVRNFLRPNYIDLEKIKEIEQKGIGIIF